MDTGHSLTEQANDQRGRLVSPAELEYIATTAHMQDTVGVWDILNTLWRRKWLIITIVASIMIAAAIVLFQLTPSYRAQSLLLIENQSPNIASMVNVA